MGAPLSLDPHIENVEWNTEEGKKGLLSRTHYALWMGEMLLQLPGACVLA